MSNLVAWGDESVRTQGQDVPAYYMGVCICNLEEVDVHRMLTTVTKRHVPKLHWRDMTPSEKRKSIPIIERLALSHIVVAAIPLDGSVSSEQEKMSGTAAARLGIRVWGEPSCLGGARIPSGRQGSRLCQGDSQPTHHRDVACRFQARQ